MPLYKILAKNLKFLVRTQRNCRFKQPARYFQDVRFEDIPDVSVSTIRGHLKRKEVSYEEHHTDFVIGCPVCEYEGKSLADKARIFINKRTGSFSCEYCHHTGSWNDMDSYISAKYSKDPVIIKELDKLQAYIKLVKKNAFTLDNLSAVEYNKLLKQFKLPGCISQQTLSTLGVTMDITRTILHFPLVNTSNTIVGYKVLRLKHQSSIEPKLVNTQSTGILMWKNCKARDNAVIVANVADFLVLVEKHVNMNVICLPNGLKGLSQHILPCFGRFNKLLLWLGDDLTAWDCAKIYAKKLGERRCYMIRPTDKVPMPHVQPDQNYREYFSTAQPIWHKSITTFASLRDDVLADLQNIDRIQGIQWARFQGLNRILKGHRRGELTVFTGPTGSGKTTFISEYSLDLAMHGVNTLWGSFEIRNARLARTMLQQMAGIPLDEHLEKFDHWADQFQQLPIYYMTFHGQQSIKVVMEAIEHATYVHDIAHVIIDNLQFMMGMTEDTRNIDRFWKQDLIISNFRTFATRKNVHVTLVIHPRKERDTEDLTLSSIFGGAKASQEADNILIIQDKRLSSVKGKKYLQVCKNRYSGDLGIMPLEFDKSSLSFAPKRKERRKDGEPKKKDSEHSKKDAELCKKDVDQNINDSELSKKDNLSKTDFDESRNESKYDVNKSKKDINQDNKIKNENSDDK